MVNFWAYFLNIFQVINNLSLPNHLNQTSTIAAQPTINFSNSLSEKNTSFKRCPYGFVGARCEFECGLSFFNQNQKIVGGAVAVAGSWPSMVYLQIKYEGYFYLADLGTTIRQSMSYSCGGVLIDENTVLTAAHCIIKSVDFRYKNSIYNFPIHKNSFYPTIESMYTVYLGLQDISNVNQTELSQGVRMKVRKIIQSPKFNDEFDLNDIAILKLASKVKLNEFIQVACLPKVKSTTYPDTNQPSWAIGWGTTSEGGSVSKQLRNVRLSIYESSKCQYVSPLQSKDWNTQICAGEYNGGKDTCQGDSGGPLFVLENFNGKQKYVLAGITSYGDGCGQSYLPGIYTRVSAFLDFITLNKFK